MIERVPLAQLFVSVDIIWTVFVLSVHPKVGQCVVPVVAPLPHVARHVVEPQFIGDERADGMGTEIAIEVVPSNPYGFIATRVGVSLRPPTTAGSIFPFSLGRQAEFHIRELVQPTDEFLHLIIVHLLYWQIVAHKVGGIVAHDGGPETLRYLVAAHIEPIQVYTVSGSLVGIVGQLFQHRLRGHTSEEKRSLIVTLNIGPSCHINHLETTVANRHCDGLAHILCPRGCPSGYKQAQSKREKEYFLYLVPHGKRRIIKSTTYSVLVSNCCHNTLYIVDCKPLIIIQTKRWPL